MVLSGREPMRTLILLTVTAGFLLASPAQGGEKKVAVFVLPTAEQAPRHLLPVQESVVSEAFLHSGEGLAWKLIAFSTVEPRQAESQMLKDVGRMVKKGMKDYRYLKLPAAQKTFESAARMLGRTPPAKCDRKTIADLYFYWARAKLDSGDEDGAQYLLSQVSRFDPKAGPDPAIMPPNLVATFDLALDSVRIKPEARVELEVGPGPGSIFVDCAGQPAKAELKGHVGEEFWLAAKVERGRFRGSFKFQEDPGRQLYIFSSRPTESVHMETHLKKLSQSRITLGTLNKTRHLRLDKVARLLGADALLVCEVTGDVTGRTANLGLYLPARGVMGKTIAVPIGIKGNPDPDGLTGAIAGLAEEIKSTTLVATTAPKKKVVKPPPVVAKKAGTTPVKKKPMEAAPPKPPGPVDVFAEVEEPTPWYSTWWFWTGAGAVVAGGVLTTILLITMDSGTTPSGKVIITLGSP
jgi:hypothetical protein